VTIVKGLLTCNIDLKVASKLFSNKFACGCSVAGTDELVIQGDFKVGENFFSFFLKQKIFLN